MVRALGRRGAVPSRPPGGRALSPSSCRRPTSPAACTSATRSTIRSRTSSSAARGWTARTRCGWSAWTMPGSPPRWWSSADLNERQQKVRTDFTRDEFVDQGVGVEGGKRRPDHPPAPPPRRQLRLGQRALHHGRGLFEGRAQGVRRALQPRIALSRQAAGQLGPAISRPRSRDLEVETRDTPGKFWTLRYPFADGDGAIEVATTRPETMLADMAVAVHPDDARYTRPHRPDAQAADHRPADPDHRRRTCRSRARQRRGQDHAAATTSTISKSASAPASSPPTCSTCSSGEGEGDARPPTA